MARRLGRARRQLEARPRHHCGNRRGGGRPGRLPHSAVSGSFLASAPAGEREVAASYSGHPCVSVQLHDRAVLTTAGWFGVIATKPMSRIGEFGPENTMLTAVVTEPTVPS